MLGLFWVRLSCLGPMLGFCWVVFGPSWDYVAPPELLWGLCSLYFWFTLDHLGTMLGLCWVFVGSSWAYVGPSWDYVGPAWVLCWAILALCWPILGLCCTILGLCRRKKRQSAKVVWKHVCKRVFHEICNVFLHIARFRSTSLETTKTTKFGSREGKTHFLQQLDSL